MKIFAATAALTLATLAPLASADGYTGKWTVDGATCDGAIVLGEYTASETCTAVNCDPIPNVTTAGAKTTCMPDHVKGANDVLKANPYVLVEVFPAASNCEGDFNIAIAVTANGKCIPGTAGETSFNVTMNPADNSALWLQYATPDCSGNVTRVEFPETNLDGETCTGGFLKALGVKPASSEPTSEPSSGYTGRWTVKGDTCDGAIVLGEYTASESCTAVNCEAIPGVTGSGVKTTCMPDHVQGANDVLKANPYVLVEVFPAASECAGKFDIAIAVTANGECIPGTAGETSFNVTMNPDNSALWLQYATPDCSGNVTSVEFPVSNLDGKTCTGGFLKALAVAPAAVDTPTTAPNSSNTSAPVPSPSGAVSTSIIGAAAFSVAAVVSASLL